jgi:DNA-binding NarL/FixJ family response regulator
MLAILADDQALVREALSQVLISYFHFEVLQAKNAEEAVVFCHQHYPSLIILDLMMPGLGSLLAVKEIREIRPDVKIAILTGRTDEDLLLRARKLGVNAYILKGDRPDELRYAIRTILDGGYYLPPSMSAAALGSRGQNLQVISKYDSLTHKEKSVLVLMAQGLQMKEVASRMSISVKTAETHRVNMGRKLGNPNRSQLVALAIKFNLTDATQILATA